MKANRKRTLVIAIVIVVLIAWNFLTIPLFLYGSFGSDAILDFSPVAKIGNALLAAWIFLFIPNFPLMGLLISLIEEQTKKVYYHLGAFICVLIGSIFFFQDNSTMALIITQVSGLFSLLVLLKQLLSKRDHGPHSFK